MRIQGSKWSARDERRKQRVKTEVNIRQLLADFGYPIHVSPLADDREEQFPCDLHGDGIDNTPSARVYTDNTVYCFVCDKARDTIALVQEKLDLSFMDAIDWLENWAGLPPLPFDPKDFGESEKSSLQKMQEALHWVENERDFGKVQKRVESYLFNVTQERELPLADVTRFWDAHDKIRHMVATEQISDFKGAALLASLLNRLKEAHADS